MWNIAISILVCMTLYDQAFGICYKGLEAIKNETKVSA